MVWFLSSTDNRSITMLPPKDDSAYRWVLMPDRFGTNVRFCHDSLIFIMRNGHRMIGHEPLYSPQ